MLKNLGKRYNTSKAKEEIEKLAGNGMDEFPDSEKDSNEDFNMDEEKFNQIQAMVNSRNLEGKISL